MLRYSRCLIVWLTTSIDSGSDWTLLWQKDTAHHTFTEVVPGACQRDKDLYRTVKSNIVGGPSHFRNVIVASYSLCQNVLKDHLGLEAFQFPLIHLQKMGMNPVFL